MPGDVLEGVDVLHEGLGRREQGGKEAAQHPWAVGGLQGRGQVGLVRQKAAQQVPGDKRLEKRQRKNRAPQGSLLSL